VFSSGRKSLNLKKNREAAAAGLGIYQHPSYGT